MIKWEVATYSGSLIGDTSFQKMYEPFQLKKGTYTNYGYGGFIENNEKLGTIISHGGSWPGYTTYFLRYPALKSSIIILSNNEFSHVARIGKRIESIILN
jgi:CubicO group peptidase (beta-lactamase class C family)